MPTGENNENNSSEHLGENGSNYSEKISEYFYTKINVENIDEFTGEADFTSNEIEYYEIPTSNDGKILLTTTKKLIRYLKLLMEVKFQKLNSELEDRISSILNDNLEDITNSLDSKSDINHVHNTSDILSLDTTLNSKADNTTLNDHIGNTSNPHNITLAQLGFVEEGWDSNPITQSSIQTSNTPLCRKYGKLVCLQFTASTRKKFLKKTNVFTLKSKYRPYVYVASFGYNARTGENIPFSIDEGGHFEFDVDVDNGTGIRIFECYLTS